jgi:methylmalonyl-CoA mutase cobalamin-binding subunit
MKTKKILGAALGNCVHVAGVMSFLRLAEETGAETHFLGPATPIADIVSAAQEWRPDVLAVSYRLTPEVFVALLKELQGALTEAGLGDIELVFGGTPPVAEIAKKSGVFTRVFSGEDGPAEVLGYLNGEDTSGEDAIPPQTLLARVKSRRPYPLLRHHFGLPDMESTLAGIQKIARARVVDVISIGPDQNAQNAFFRPEDQDPMQDGAGGVPVRTLEDMRSLYAASRAGNYPLLRCYSGTRDLLSWAQMNIDTINNAWAAVPLCWYNALDGRSNRPPAESIPENLEVMAWHGARDIPVEVNESHHWSLRQAPDSIAVAAAYLAALNAKAQGVKTYIAQYMFNTPYGTSYPCDLAKMLAKKQLIEELIDDKFTVLRQVRTGLMSLSANMAVAKGQLASSIDLALNLDPHIVHVVGYSEANFAATADVVIESSQIIHGVIRNQMHGRPDACLDAKVLARKDVLLDEARLLLEAIGSIRQGRSSLTDPSVLAKAIDIGLLDAPNLKGNLYARGDIVTAIRGGACVTIDERGQTVPERTRIERVFGRVR